MFPQFAALIDGQAAAAVEGLAGAHNAGIQPRRCGDELEHGAGHIQLGDVLILPLCLAHHTLQLGVFAGDLVAVLINRFIAANPAVSDDVLDRLFPKAALQPVDVLGVDLLFIQNGRHLGVRDLVGVVGVKLLDGRHGQNRAGLDVHDDGTAAAMHREGVHCLGQIFFDDGLHIFVDGQEQVVAVDSLVHIGLPCGQGVAVDIRLGHTAARRACQGFIVVFFQAVSALAIAVAEAQHRGEELAVGVAAGRGLFGRKVQNAFAGRGAVLGVHAVLIGIVQDGIRHRLIHALGEHTVLIRLAAAVFSGQNLIDGIRSGVPAQQCGNVFRRRAQLAFRRAALGDRGRVCNDIPYRAALGKQLAVDAVNRAAQRGQRRILQLLGHGLGAVEFGITQLQGVELINQQTECADDKECHAEERAGFHRCVGAGAVLFWLVVWLWHKAFLISKSLFAVGHRAAQQKGS